jgi:hypothetical protein
MTAGQRWYWILVQLVGAAGGVYAGVRLFALITR